MRIEPVLHGCDDKAIYDHLRAAHLTILPGREELGVLRSSDRRGAVSAREFDEPPQRGQDQLHIPPGAPDAPIAIPV